ncbi:4-alpha-glucanotransferase [Paenibacillus curdlanolyticus YK9]|uniref:4-alpha-glucanotransferase n=1 Tax=Paenibacillus curdlanolyticus YK9 TaxID=717606 RepID=E0I4Z3_9BACL|nr:4-alpha-glucanotransferase [Paenibacillus curdlanolyticus]EFM12035.1 4-alpha-glucanotransferase [Paenibacillus curdlanolyticus YK9]
MSSIAELLLQTNAAEQWKRIGTERRVGVLMPLSSLYSSRSAGVGDFEDLKLAADWCARTGHTILQLLPLNDYYHSPYSTFSLFALDPMYTALDRLIGVPPSEIAPEIEAIRERFPTGLGCIDYDVKQAKLDALYAVFTRLDNAEDHMAYQDFAAENRDWLDDYALYTALKYDYSPFSWEQWEPEYRDAEPSTMLAFTAANDVRIRFVKWLQWQLYEQLKAAKQHANAIDVQLMGDLFYIVSRDSADVWKRRECFWLDLVPGLPPEPAHMQGQRWGDQPVYHWDTVTEAGGLMERRLQYCEHFYNIARLDTVSALFKMWYIPRSAPDELQGVPGFYYPDSCGDFSQRGRDALTKLQSFTSMLLCAENLSPACLVYTPVIRELGVPPINFQRWDKDWDVRHDFIPPNELHPVTIFTLSNHDTSLWADWWEREAGTIDASKLESFCEQHQLDAARIQRRLFDATRSSAGKLRWRDTVSTPKKLAELVGLPMEHIGAFIHDYRNSYGEKEKLWAQMKLQGPMREKADREIIQSAIELIFSSNAVWSIVSMLDYLCMLAIIDGDYDQYRLNRPGTERGRNWTLALPVPLEALLEEKHCSSIRQMIGAVAVS